jgi:hypothetical protein
MRTKAQIQEIQRLVGTVPDGRWGPISRRAADMYFRGLAPRPHPFPATDEASLQAFYGSPGDTSKHVRIAVGNYHVRFSGQIVREITVHRKCADSLLSIIEELATFDEGLQALSRYAGVYVDRPMRGGTRPSLHARAAAIDLWPSANGLHTPWPVTATMPVSVMEVFARHGWLCAGSAWGRDAMHFQATR